MDNAGKLNYQFRGTMKKLSLLVCILALCCGCTTLNIDITPVENDGKRSLIYVKHYTIGEKITAYIGQPMVSWQEGFVGAGQQYIVFKDEFNLNFNYIQPPLPIIRSCTIVGKKGYESVIRYMAVYDGAKYFIVDEECDSGYFSVGLLINEDDKLNKTIFTDSAHITGYEMRNVTLSPPTTHFAKIAKPDMRGGISRELIFGGVNNVSINVTYREYTPDDTARQAFYQNVIYQTSAEMIRFQDFKIKVHEVTNEKIVFTVLEDGLGVPTP